MQQHDIDNASIERLATEQASLIYIYDPMCSWCWGFAPTWQKLQHKIYSQNLCKIDMKVGGLAPDSDQDMPADMQKFLQQTWQKISRTLGTEFNFDFWTKCQPRRSTYPACRAVLIARSFDKEQEMLLAIQQAYYLNAQNPSDIELLIALAAQLNIPKESFAQQLVSNELNEQLLAEINFARQLPIAGFPSLVVINNGNYHSISLDYKNEQTMLREIKHIIGGSVKS